MTATAWMPRDVAPLPRAAEPVLAAAVADLEGALDRMSAGSWDDLPATEARDLCARLSRVRSRIDAQQVGAARALERSGAARKAGAVSTGAMIGMDFGGDRASGEALVRTGKALDKAGASATEDAMAAGSISRAQAAVIATALGRLPRETTPTQRRRCERVMLEDARRLTLPDLRRRGDRISDVVAPPESADRRENDLVEARERRAWWRTELSMTDRGDGTWGGRFVIPEVQAAMLRALLDAQAAPRRRHLAAAPDATEDLSHSQRLGRAFCSLVEHVPTQGYAASGGTPALITVAIDLAALRQELSAATLDTGETLSAGQLRRLACEHGLLPLVLGGRSLPLDVGSSQRLFTTAQRLALASRDQGCAMPGCDRPAAWTEAHHITPWAQQRRTDLSDGVLLCAHHHRMVHDQHWQIRLDPRDGMPEFRHPDSTRWERNQSDRPARGRPRVLANVQPTALPRVPATVLPRSHDRPSPSGSGPPPGAGPPDAVGPPRESPGVSSDATPR